MNIKREETVVNHDPDIIVRLEPDGLYANAKRFGVEVKHKGTKFVEVNLRHDYNSAREPAMMSFYHEDQLRDLIEMAEAALAEIMKMKPGA